MTAWPLTVLMYHYVRDPGDPAEAGSGIPGLPLARFEAQLEQACRHYTVLAWPEVRQSLLNGRPLPASGCLLTFDDGVCDHYLNVFPALQARGLSGMFFALARTSAEGLVSAHKIHFLLARLGLAGLREAVWERLDGPARAVFQGAEARYRTRHGEVDVLKSILQRDLSAEAGGLLGELFARVIGPEEALARRYYLNGDQVREMARGGMHFGGHSRSHPWFDWIDAQGQAAEIKASADWLAGVERGPWAFAYPYGGLSPAAPGLLETHGFAAAFTTVTQAAHVDRFYIGRLDAEELPAEWVAAPAGYG